MDLGNKRVVGCERVGVGGEVDVEVERVAESLNESDAAGSAAARPYGSVARRAKKRAALRGDGAQPFWTHCDSSGRRFEPQGRQPDYMS